LTAQLDISISIKELLANDAVKTVFTKHVGLSKKIIWTALFCETHAESREKPLKIFNSRGRPGLFGQPLFDSSGQYDRNAFTLRCGSPYQSPAARSM
jgi:hypothetical protein